MDAFGYVEGNYPSEVCTSQNLADSSTHCSHLFPSYSQLLRYEVKGKRFSAH